MSVAAQAAYAELQEACAHAYTLHFAGLPRLTRRPELLQGMIDRLTPHLERLPPQLKAGAQAQVQRYQDELRAVTAAQQQAGAQGCALAQLSAQASQLRHLYGRHCGGRSRLLVDDTLLDSLAARADALLAPHHDAQAPACAALRADGALYAEEAQAVRAARAQGDAATRAAHLAALANHILERYAALVLERPLWVVPCVPMARMQRALINLRTELQALGNLDTEALRHNLAQLDQEIARIDGELTAARAAQKAAPTVERCEALLAEADSLLEQAQASPQASGKEAEADARMALSDLCDRADALVETLRLLAADNPLVISPVVLGTTEDILTWLMDRYLALGTTGV